jgi:hypothetical protein
MKMKDMDRKRNEKLNDIEEEEKIKSEHLKARAVEQLQEQEDDIKKLNEVYKSNFNLLTSDYYKLKKYLASYLFVVRFQNCLFVDDFGS